MGRYIGRVGVVLGCRLRAMTKKVNFFEEEVLEL